MEMNQYCMKFLTLKPWASTFISDLEQEMGCSLIKFADDNNLEDIADIFCHSQESQQLEEWANRNIENSTRSDANETD